MDLQLAVALSCTDTECQVRLLDSNIHTVAAFSGPIIEHRIMVESGHLVAVDSDANPPQVVYCWTSIKAGPVEGGYILTEGGSIVVPADLRGKFFPRIEAMYQPVEGVSPGTLVFETERLSVRAATVDDVDMFYALWRNPQVMANVGFPQGVRVTRSELKERLLKQRGAEFDRLLVIERKDTGQSIGECKLSYPNEEGIAEPDTKLLPAHWGHKYGQEVWRGLVAYQFRHTDCVAVEATPNVENIASIRMQEAVGGVRVGEGVYEFPEAMRDYTTPVHLYVYRVNRADWEENTST